MRAKERIPLFLEKIDSNYSRVIQDCYKLPIEEIPGVLDIINAIENKILNIKKYWEENHDLRFSQVLVNLGVIQNYPGNWYYMEENEILEILGFEPRDYLFWGANFDKDMNKLPGTIRKPIKELKTDHIQAIIDGNWCRSDTYLKCFKDELKLRENDKKRI